MDTVSILVTLTIPPGESATALAAHVKDAVAMWLMYYETVGGDGDPPEIISITQLGVTTDIPEHGPA